MAQVTEAPVRAFAHCPDPRCPGNQQEPVDGLQRHTQVLYTDTDPNGIPGVEKSWDSVSFADEEQAPCPHCATYREITTQERPTYENRSGQDPQELIRRQNAKQAEDRSQMQDLVDALRESRADAPAIDPDVVIALQAQIAELRAELDGKANKSGPKPKAE